MTTFLKGHGTENDFVLVPDHDGESGPVDPELVTAPGTAVYSGSGHSGSGPRSAPAHDHASVWSEGCGLGACRLA